MMSGVCVGWDMKRMMEGKCVLGGAKRWWERGRCAWVDVEALMPLELAFLVRAIGVAPGK